MSATTYAITAVAGALVGVLIALVAVYRKQLWHRLSEKLLKRKGRSRWRIEEVRCPKCINSPKPGWVNYTTFDPAIGEEVNELLSCDKCDITGKIKIVVIADDMDLNEWYEAKAEMRKAGHAEGFDFAEHVKRESEVREASE